MSFFGLGKIGFYELNLVKKNFFFWKVIFKIVNLEKFIIV